MKKNLKLSILIIALMAITATGCKKMEEVYSCNPETNKWVKENLSPIQQMNRQDLLELEPEKRIPAYRAFTVEQKYECWIDKFEQIKSLPWTPKEFTHISLLAESIEEEWFERNLNKDEIVNYLLKWGTDGMNFFGWSEYEVGCLISCLYDVKMEDDNVVFLMPPGGGVVGGDDGNGALKNCNCNKSLFGDFCGIDGPCMNVECEEQFFCGILLLQTCNGRCNSTL